MAFQYDNFSDIRAAMARELASKNTGRKFHYLMIAAGLLLITLSVNISMPLFRVYAASAHMNNGQTSLVFAAYVAGMLPCYVFLGGLSDRLGRKPVVIASTLFALLATAIVTIWPDVWALIFARFFQGVAVGLGMGAGTAYISELMKPDTHAPSKAAALASSFTAFGFGGGAMVTSIALLVHFTTRPITYMLLLAVTAIGIIFLFRVPPLPAAGGQLIRLPFFPKGSAGINTAIGICWAATGVVIAIIPTQLARYGLTPYAGFCLVLVNWTGAFVQPLLRRYDPLRLVRVGLLLVPLGFGLVVLGCNSGQLPVILAGTSIVGLAAYGFSYLGGLALITTLGQQHKARAVSGYMFIGYVGFGMPAIFLGYLADHYGIIASLLVFELAIVVLSGWLFFIFSRPAYAVITKLP